MALTVPGLNYTIILIAMGKPKIDFDKLGSVKEKVAVVLWANLNRNALNLETLTFGDRVYLIKIFEDFPKSAPQVFDAVFIGTEACEQGRTKLQTKLNSYEVEIATYNSDWVLVPPSNSIPLSPEHRITVGGINLTELSKMFKDYDKSFPSIPQPPYYPSPAVPGITSTDWTHRPGNVWWGSGTASNDIKCGSGFCEGLTTGQGNLVSKLLSSSYTDCTVQELQSLSAAEAFTVLNSSNI